MLETTHAKPSPSGGLAMALAIRKDPLTFFTRLMTEQGAYTHMKIKGRRVLVLNDAKGIEYVLQGNAKNYRKGYFQNILKSLFGRSMFLDEGEPWRKGRVRAAPVFANGNFDEMVCQMVKAAEAMFDRWQPMIERGEPIDITIEMTQFALDALLRALFHESSDNVASNMRANLGVILRDTEDRLWSIASVPEIIAHNLGKYRRARKFLTQITGALIDARQAKQVYPDDLLSRIVRDFSADPDEQRILYDEVLSFVLAGHDTTAHSLAWSLYTLAHHPLEQARMEDEVATVLGQNSPTYADVQKLTYTRQIFDEMLRLYPPVWTMSREAIQEDTIPLDKEGESVVIPADTAVMMCQYAVQRREDYWPNPEAFNPDHFTSENVRRRPKYAWFPFGGGPRQCLGFRFAQIEAAMALAMITQRYELTLIPGQKVLPEPIITLRPSCSIYFRVRPRVGVTIARSPEMPDVNPVIAEPSKAASRCPFHHAAE